MSDEIDMASELEEMQREVAIAKARKQEKRIFTGYCDFCNEKLSTGKRFCSAECRDDYELESAAMKRHRGRA